MLANDVPQSWRKISLENSVKHVGERLSSNQPGSEVAKNETWSLLLFVGGPPSRIAVFPTRLRQAKAAFLVNVLLLQTKESRAPSVGTAKGLTCVTLWMKTYYVDSD
jgi:hypothetical protein